MSRCPRRPAVGRAATTALAIAAAGVLLVSPTSAQDDPEEITLELIMSDPDWIGRAPENPYWSADGTAVYFLQKRLGEERSDLHRIDLESEETSRVADEDLGLIDRQPDGLSRDRQHAIWARRGDIYLQNRTTGAIRQLTRTAVAESQPQLLADGRRVSYVRDGSTFIRDLENGLEIQAAELVLSDDPAEDAEDDGFLAQQQLELFDVVRERRDRELAERQAERQEQQADPTRPPLPWYLGDDVEVLYQALSPDAGWMLLIVADDDADFGRRDQMASWVTDDGYVDVREVRPKVGTGDGKGHRLVLLDLGEHQRHDLDLGVLPGISDDPLAALRAAQEADETGEGENSEDSENGEDGEDAPPRAVDIEQIRFSPDGRRAAVQLHSYDNKDRWTALVERSEPGLQPIHRLSFEGWINWSFNELDWLDDDTLYFLSEESGYSQLYLYDAAEDATRRLTDGDFVVSDPQPSPDRRYLYYTANRDHPGVYETFRVDLETGANQRLTELGGITSYRLSPDGERLLLTYSTTVRPPELFLQEARPGAAAVRLTHTVSERFAAIDWVAPQIVEVPSSHHERAIHSRFYPPTDGDAAGPRPAVVFVHGAGYLQNAHKGWSGYFREFMFHTFLSRHGYPVLDMDYRASRGYGAAWRQAIYRDMGRPELEDLGDGVDWLVAEHGVDRGRIGVYGGSYGGFMTMMALFLEPDLFACGAALRPVTDWAHYNHPYTSNILNTPDVDPEAYARSSPIEHAAGLRKPLLICAPMLDDNVFFQDTVRLAQRLIELEKENWEVAIFPVEPHGFRRPSSWLNEYRRIFALFEENLR